MTAPKRAIGGKGLNSGIRGGLWDKKHSDRMGEAVFLFGWLVHRQTTERNGRGLVLRGKPLTYADITADTGWPERTLQRWMARLQKGPCPYIEVSHSTYSRMVIHILNPKKLNPKQLEFTARPEPSSPPEVAELSPPSPPGVADITTKSGGLKERAEIEQKKLAAAAAALNSGDVWTFLGIPPCGPPAFRQLLESRWACRDGRSPTAVLGETVDAWEAANGEKPRQAAAFFRALAEIRRRERETAQPTLDEIAPIPSEVLERCR